MNGILHVSGMLTKSGLPMSERLSEAGIMVVKGMLMVFAVLAILMLVLMLMERFFVKKPAPKKVVFEKKGESKGKKMDSKGRKKK